MSDTAPQSRAVNDALSHIMSQHPRGTNSALIVRALPVVRSSGARAKVCGYARNY